MAKYDDDFEGYEDLLDNEDNENLDEFEDLDNDYSGFGRKSYAYDDDDYSFDDEDNDDSYEME